MKRSTFFAAASICLCMTGCFGNSLPKEDTDFEPAKVMADGFCEEQIVKVFEGNTPVGMIEASGLTGHVSIKDSDGNPVYVQGVESDLQLRGLQAGEMVTLYNNLCP